MEMELIKVGMLEPIWLATLIWMYSLTVFLH